MRRFNLGPVCGHEYQPDPTFSEVDMTLDLRRLLDDWPYDPDKDVRLEVAADGRQIILVRKPMGLEQYEMESSPNGPGCSGIERRFARLAEARRTGRQAACELSSADCAELDKATLCYSCSRHFSRLNDSARAEEGMTRARALRGLVRQHAKETHSFEPEALDMTGERANPRLLEESVFAWEGDCWTILYQGAMARLKDARGLQYLARLLCHAGSEFYVSELVAGGKRVPAGVGVGEVARAMGLREVRSVSGGAGAILDARAKADLRYRIVELREDLEEAEQRGDGERGARAREELSAIAAQVASAVGLGGRDRPTGSEAERARSAVTKRIKESIKRIGARLPPLGWHLRGSVKTGYFCSYNPSPEESKRWRVVPLSVEL